MGSTRILGKGSCRRDLRTLCTPHPTPRGERWVDGMANGSLAKPAMGVQTVVCNVSSKLDIWCTWASHYQERPAVIYCTKDKQTGMPVVVKNGNSVTQPRRQAISEDASGSEREGGWRAARHRATRPHWGLGMWGKGIPSHHHSLPNRLLPFWYGSPPSLPLQGSGVHLGAVAPVVLWQL